MHTGGDADARLRGTKGEKWMESSLFLVEHMGRKK
jgi:hypothetical protein